MSRLRACVVLVVAACAAKNESIVVEQDSVRPGTDCAVGGVRISAGVDDDGSGTLEPGEVDDVEFICRTPITFEGSLVITNEQDAERLRDVLIVTGSLTIKTSMVDLSALVEVGGALSVDASRIVAPRLQSVGGAASLRLRSPCRLELPALQSVGGDLSAKCFDGDGEFLYELPSLETIGGGLEADSQNSFTVAELTVDVPKVARLDFLRVLRGNPGEFGANQVVALRMPALTTLDGPLVFRETDLGEVVLPNLRAAASIEIRSTRLCNSEAMALVDQTGAPSQLGQNLSCAQ